MSDSALARHKGKRWLPFVIVALAALAFLTEPNYQRMIETSFAQRDLGAQLRWNETQKRQPKLPFSCCRDAAQACSSEISATCMNSARNWASSARRLAFTAMSSAITMTSSKKASTCGRSAARRSSAGV